MAEPRQVIERLRARQPDVVRLATLAAAATVVEPALLRRLRLELLPQVDAGAEADLWFSALVERASPQAMSLRQPVADLLRRELGDRDAAAAQGIVAEAHAGRSELQQLEDRMVAVALRGGDAAALLYQARATVAANPDAALDVLRWYRQASGRIPTAAADSPVGRELTDRARLNLDRRVPAAILAADAFPRGAGALLNVRLPEVTVGVSRTREWITFRPVGDDGVTVPATVPPVIEVRWSTSRTSRSRVVAVDEAVRVELGAGVGDVVLTTLAGGRFRVLAPPPTRRGNRIFISYRRRDGAASAGRLYDRLVAELGNEEILMDVDSIGPGSDFAEAVRDAVRTCHTMLVLIGPGWLYDSSESGIRRLDNPDDFVRIEIELALELGLRVIPVLIDGASMPRPSDLPPSLASLARRNAAVLNHETFSRDVDRIIAALPEPRRG